MRSRRRGPSFCELVLIQLFWSTISHILVSDFCVESATAVSLVVIPFSIGLIRTATVIMTRLRMPTSHYCEPCFRKYRLSEKMQIYHQCPSTASQNRQWRHRILTPCLPTLICLFTLGLAIFSLSFSHARFDLLCFDFLLSINL
jgi:hypothetical protein